jgi:hypothetical protein
VTEPSKSQARVWQLEVHTSNVGQGSIEAHFESLTAEDAIAKMEASPDRRFVIRQRGDAPPSDLAALDAFQKRTGKGFQRL